MTTHILPNENQKTSKQKDSHSPQRKDGYHHHAAHHHRGRPPLRAPRKKPSSQFSVSFSSSIELSILVDSFSDLVFDLKLRGAGASAVSHLSHKNPILYPQPRFYP